MSYSEKDGQVTLTMDRNTYDNLLLAMGIATGWALHDGNKTQANALFRLINKLNEGNPNFNPYRVD